MLFHSLLGGPELGGDLLVHLPGDNKLQDFVLARGQTLDASARFHHLGTTYSGRPVAVQRNIDGAEQILVPKRLRKKLERSGLHGPNADRNGSVAGDENDREGHVQIAQLVGEIEAAPIWQTDVEHQTGRSFDALSSEELLR